MQTNHGNDNQVKQARAASTAPQAAERSRTLTHYDLSSRSVIRDERKQKTIAPPETSNQAADSDRLERFTNGKHSRVFVHPIPNELADTRVGLIDWLAFTLTPPEGQTYLWVIRELQQLFGLGFDGLTEKNGRFGFKSSATFDGGIICWGGDSQRGKIFVSFQGAWCSRVQDWPAISAWLEKHHATLKRVDVAYDDFTGKTVTIEKSVEWYESGGFNAGGRKPDHRCAGDWLDGAGSTQGRTLYVGKRGNGKICRIYEKGKQLGDTSSPWVRIETEWSGEGRVIPYDILTRPGQYLAGSYPCLNFLSVHQSRIKTISRGAKIVFEKALDNLKQQGGKLINLALKVFQGDYAQVIERLKREGIPKRIEPYSYHIERSPEMLAGSGGMAAFAT